MVEGFTFDDVLIVPAARTRVESRRTVDTTHKLGEVEFSVPVMTASMAMFDTANPIATQLDSGFAWRMADAGGVHIFSRATPFEQRMDGVDYLASGGLNTGVAVSLDEFFEFQEKLEKIQGLVSIDIANGALIPPIRWRGVNPLIIGNFANPEAVFREGSDFDGDFAFKFGVGSGAACSTREVTGVGYPQAALIHEARKNSGETFIISDGGVRNSGDFVKAVALGADFVMTGRLFGGCLETPWRSFVKDGVEYKPYRGMASREQKGSEDFVEGVSGRVPVTGSLYSVVASLEQGLSSAMSYVNATNIMEFMAKAEFVYSPSSGVENSTRV